MIITPREHGLILNAPAPGYVRSPGLHVSAIYNDLYAKLEPDRYGGTDGPDPLRMELGLAFEEMLEEGLKRRLIGERPGEFFTPEGIAFSPDMLIFEDDRMVVGEFKCSSMSCRGLPTTPAESFPPKFNKWMTQMLAYCHNLETPYARLYSLFINGDYRHTGPQLLCWSFTFTARELQDNWRMLMNHAKHAGIWPVEETV